MNTAYAAVSILIFLFTWLPTYSIMRRKLIRERALHHKALIRMDDAAFELGRIAGRDEERRDFTTIELAGRTYDLPST